MGNSASTASGQCLYHGFDSAPSRDQRPAYTQLLNAAAVASSSRRTFYTGRAVSLMNGLLASSSESAAAESKALESHTDGSSVSDDAALDSDEEAMPIPNGISPGTPLRHQSGVAPMMDSGRTTIPQVLKDQAREILRGDLSEGIMRLADRTSVKVFFSSNASDTEWERNALMMDVWPYLARFCKVLDLDFEIYDLRSGDKYSTPALPSVIPASEFTMMEDYLTKNNRSRDVRELLHVWFVRDDNAVPPVYNLRPISTIIPAFCSKAADPETQMEAFKSWEEIRYRLAALLRAGSRALGTEATSQNRFGRSLMEEELAVAYPHRTGTETERFYGFQRTLLDIKRKYVDNGPVASRYLDLINNQIDKDAVNQMAGLRNRIRANRFYAIPWRTDNFGLSPDSEKSHGTYLKSFCDDATRLLSEGILKHFTSRPFTRDWDPLAAEILRHHLAVREESKAFVGRSDELENIREFLDDSSGSVCVLYGPPGVGKTALISKTAEMVRESYPTSTLVIRVYGYAAMRQRIEEASSNAANAGDGYADDTFDKLLGDLESWPPTSYEGLKAALPLVLSLATDAKPVVLIIDALDELSDSDDARDLDWLPSILPPNVKLLISSAPSSLYQPTLSALKSIFPESEDNRYVEVPVMSDADTDALVSKVQERSSRNLTDDQLSVFRSKCLASRMPLYIHSAWTLSASKWTSEGTNLGLAKKLLSAETLMGLVEDTLDRLESKLGRTFVSRALGYVTAARRGLSKSELEDVLSCDEDVLAESHEQFRRFAEDRYLFRDRAIATHSALADYWEGKWARTPKPYIDSATGQTKSVLRYIMDQSLLVSGKPNTRRLASLVWHHLEAGVTGFQDAARTLQDLSHIGAALDAGLLWDLLASYRAALSRDSAEGLLLPQLVDYYRFLLTSAYIVASDPRQLIPVAVNLYQGSVVADDARKWIAANAPGLCWAEWANRPLARGEPIATLRGSDGGEPGEQFIITGRDTFGELVALVGLRIVDGARVASIYDTAEIKAAATGGGTARLLAKGVLPEDESGEDEGNPLVCAFSRSGNEIAIASRTILVVSTQNLSQCGMGTDPDLPEGDVITAISWTKDDGCIVTASDGAEPGRIALWDAVSFTLLRVIKAQYPRQPISSSFRTMGFWDEYRSLFILLDVDELAADAESGLFLQYIPSVPHSDPPPDGPSRFAPIARLPMDVDKVRQVVLSHDGQKVAIVPNDSKVISIFGLQARDNSSGQNDTTQRKRKDIILGIASHPTKPLMAAVTDSGNVTLIAADRMPDEPGTWVGSLWTSAFGKAKLEDDKVMTFNAREAGTQAGTTCITFLPSAGAPLTPQTTTAPTESLLFATGHEDGSVSVWEWNATIDPLDLSPAVTLRLNAGRITSLVASELVPPKSSNRYMAITVDDTAVLLWNGVNDDPESALVLVPPLDTTEEDQLSNISQSRVSVFAKQQGGEWNLNRPCAVAFSRTKELVLAAGSVAGTIAIWNIENKARVILMTPSSVEQKPAPIMAIAWAADDAALVSASEDKRISIHNTVTGDLVWVHSLWMVVPRLNVAAFTSGARQLAIVDHDAVPIPVEDKTPELSASPSRHPTYVPLKFVCGSEDELGREDPMLEEMEDPELQGLRGFTRLFPVEEQVSIAGTGMVTLHLGYVKAACKLNTCCIDLKRIPGTGEPFSFGKVHFIPVDPRLYRPEYEPPLHQVDAFTRLLASFEAFEESHRKRAESLSQNLPENMSALKAQHEDDDSASDNAADHRRTWVAGEDEASAAVEAKRKTRMSMFQPLSNVVGGILGAVGGLAVAEPAKPTKPPSFADIEREMELARVKARLEAKILEEEEDEKNAYEEAKERHRLAEEVTKARNLDRGPDDFDQDDEQGIDEEEHYYRLKEAEEALRRIELALENSAEAVATDVESELRETAVEPDIARLAAEPDVKELAIGQDVGELAAEADVGEAVEPDSIEVAVEPDAGKAGVERDVREVGIEPDTRKVVDLNASKVAVESIVGEAPALNGATVEIVDGEGV
ncbi:NACHT domain- and WD repeat-containing protein 1 [Irineochytrium annulatum]|nr:NACHT domain- and WD repeat-containing protein 1 [Irineochytrium annulatum]